jgi:transposase
MQNPALQSLQLPALPAAHGLPVVATADCTCRRPARKKEISWRAVRYHFCKWSADGSLQRVWQQSIVTIKHELDLSQLHLDGSHAPAKKGGEQVAYQHRKRAKTSNILSITERNGYVIATTGIIAGNHHDAFELPLYLAQAFKGMKRLGLKISGAFFNADSAFDTKATRRICFNHKIIPNLAINSRNQRQVKRGRRRLFNAAIYKQRFTSERTFAWIDKFRALLVRFDRLAHHFLAGHYLAYTLINLRHILAQKA